MNTKLTDMIDAMIAGDEDAATAHLKDYLTVRTKEIISEGQGNLFGEEPEQETKERFLVKPIGVSYAKKEHAIEAAKNHPKKDVSVVDTETDEVVYSHDGKKKPKD